MRPIDADALKEAIANQYNLNDPPTLYWWNNIKKIIDNAPELGYEDGILSIENAVRKAIELEDAYNNGWSDGFSEGRGDDNG